MTTALTLSAAVGFALVPPTEPELRLLHRWLDSWRGIGARTARKRSTVFLFHLRRSRQYRFGSPCSGLRATRGLPPHASGIHVSPEPRAIVGTSVGHTGLACSRGTAGVNPRCRRAVTHPRYAVRFRLAVSGLRIRTSRDYDGRAHSHDGAERTKPPRCQDPHHLLAILFTAAWTL